MYWIRVEVDRRGILVRDTNREEDEMVAREIGEIVQEVEIGGNSSTTTRSRLLPFLVHLLETNLSDDPAKRRRSTSLARHRALDRRQIVQVQREEAFAHPFHPSSPRLSFAISLQIWRPTRSPPAARTVRTAQQDRPRRQYWINRNSTNCKPKSSKQD